MSTCFFALAAVDAAAAAALTAACASAAAFAAAAFVDADDEPVFDFAAS